MPHPAADRNLLFGILALQMDFIRRDDLIAAMNAWVLDKAKPLGQILSEQGVLSVERRGLLEALIQEHLKQHDNDPRRSLAAVSSIRSVRQDLQQIADADLQVSLMHVSAGDNDPYATRPESAGAGTAPGLRFRILRPHAKGGLGEVFVAHDQELHREVALKEIQDRHADHPESRARFLLEAEVTGGLEHPGIVPVYGLGTYADGRPFYAMRFIRGDSLQDAITSFHQEKGMLQAGERTLRLRQLVGRFVDVCQAVAYAHSRGVLHRDLKPGNVMLGKYGQTLVVDWGLAKVLNRADVEITEGPLRLSGDSAMTQTGQALGTPAYMSPEQAAGKLEQLGPRSDVYSLGATLYCLLTGQAPFSAADVGQVLNKVQRGEYTRPRELDRHIHLALEAISCKAMAVKPDERYPSPDALAADVERWLADEPVSAWREPLTVRGRRWLGKHRTLVTSASAAAVVAIVGLTVGLVFVTQARNVAEAKGKEAREQRNDARRNLYIAQMNLVPREYEAKNIVHVWDLLKAQTSWPLDMEDQRSFEWYYWNLLAHPELRTLKAHETRTLGVATSPDGQRFASTDGATVQVWDAASGEKTLALKLREGYVSSLAFSPDGRRIAGGGVRYARDDGILLVWDAASGRELLSLVEPNRRVESVVFSPDGRRLAAGCWDRTVRVWDASSGEETFHHESHKDNEIGLGVHYVAFSPDGRRLAGANADTVRVWDASSGQELHTLKGHKGVVNSVAFSPNGQQIVSGGGVNSVAFRPNGQQIVSGGGDDTVQLWDASSGQELRALKGQTGLVYSVGFSPDGRRIASASLSGTVRVWDAASWQELHTHTVYMGPVHCVVLGADGRQIVSGYDDGTIRVWDAGVGQEALSLKGHSGAIGSVAFSPDGRRIASAGEPGTLRVWDTVSGQALLCLTGHAAIVDSAAFSPDGRRIAGACRDGTVRVWDVTGGQEPLTLQGNAGPVQCVAFSPDGSRIASACGDNTVKVWDTNSRQLICNFRGHTTVVTSLAFSPDGRRIASCGEGNTVRVWDAGNNQDILLLQDHKPTVTSIAFSPDGGRLASANSDGTVRVWDASSGQEALVFQGHAGKLACVTYSPDGRRITTGDSGGTVRAWDAVNGQEVLVLQGHAQAVTSVAFSADGRRFASGGEDGAVRVWETQLVSADDIKRREIVKVVQDMYDRLLIRSEVLAGLRKDETLDAPIRETALQVAQAIPEDPLRLYDAAWKVVQERDGIHDAYALAFRRAEAAVQIAPDNGLFLNTLGVAHYRLGDFAKAVETLERSEKFKATEDGSLGVSLSFLAMAQHQFGHKERARATLARLREVKKQLWGEEVSSSPEKWRGAMESQRRYKYYEAEGFLREAEELIEGKPEDKKE
jgi:WD40 repeat protein/serine/threonine protein kinase